MESGQQHDSKTSSEESDNKADQVNDDAGTGRSYECVFCKRGFTTAQALGGHMNIHRKDRAKIRQPTVPSVSNQPMEEYARPGFSMKISTDSPFSSPALETHRNYQTFYPASTSITRHGHGYHAEDLLHIQNPRPLSLFEEDRHTNLSLQIGPTDVEDKQEEKRQDEEEDELDLELRLGHDP